MKLKTYIILFFLSNSLFGQVGINNNIINASRNSCVKIISKQGNSSGTGFFISNDIIVTCFHIIAEFSLDSAGIIKFNIYSDLIAVTEDGDSIPLSCISVPSNTALKPLLYDFALLKANKMLANKSILPLGAGLIHNVSDLILFTGYPLGTPTMVTHFGTISGITKDSSIICIQASTNKGNSGGALINKEGKVIGIISMREGGISIGLQHALGQITQAEKHADIKLVGINQLQITKETILALDRYISTGIGYARNIKYLNDYITKRRIKI